MPEEGGGISAIAYMTGYGKKVRGSGGASLPRALQPIPNPSVPCTSLSALRRYPPRRRCQRRCLRGQDGQWTCQGGRAGGAWRARAIEMGCLVSLRAASRPGFSLATPIAYGIANAKQADRIICPEPSPLHICAIPRPFSRPITPLLLLFLPSPRPLSSYAASCPSALYLYSLV
ncbi:hypothetical protein OH77DRAFT_715618 [Trametes cingulata]|nr:hypothetical protein OH77DRAFT_715618 [Trametes cingulata]